MAGITWRTAIPPFITPISRRAGSGTDLRMLGHAALVRSGQLDRDAALAELAVPQTCPDEILALVKKRLDLSDAEFERLMTLPLASWRDFETYKAAVRALAPVLLDVDEAEAGARELLHDCRPLA